uniref:Condensin complex subunit 2 n=1 Tax=Junco hyemalis TaxID=40217 RepID=A0A8C5IEE1_JUNHY
GGGVAPGIERGAVVMAVCSPCPAAAPAAFLSPSLQAPGSTGTPVFAECPDNDDERERRQRRRSRAVESSLEGLGSPSTEKWRSPLPQWTDAQIAEHYKTCIKLSAENKITTKNAFGLHLIDYMADMLKQDNSELINFQMAAGAVEASAKIYAMRVDSLHAETFRVLGQLGKQPRAARDADAARKAQPKKKQQGYKTIEQNLSNINAPEGSQRPEVDPMFQRFIASFDECSAVGIFLTGLRSRDFQSRLLFPSELVPLPSSESLALPSSQPVTVPGLKALLARCVEKRPICSSLAGFRFTEWDQESHDESVSALLERFRGSEHAFDPSLDPGSEEGEGPAPSQPEFLPESPAGAGSPREFTGADLGEGDVSTMSRHVSLNPGEYSYFSPRVLSMWAGPEHWRFRPRQPRECPGQGEREFWVTLVSPCVPWQVPDSDDDPDPAEFPGQAGPLPLPAHPEAPELPGIDGGSGCGELELIAEPPKVRKIPIPYAKTAKRMDMRRLKRNMWELLTEQGEQEEEEAGEGTDVKVAGEKSLSGLIKDLRHRLPPTMASELSVPLAFISLLHLANEKNLELEGTEDLSDVLVRGGD